MVHDSDDDTLEVVAVALLAGVLTLGLLEDVRAGEPRLDVLRSLLVVAFLWGWALAKWASSRWGWRPPAPLTGSDLLLIGTIVIGTTGAVTTFLSEASRVFTAMWTVIAAAALLALAYEVRTRATL